MDPFYNYFCRLRSMDKLYNYSHACLYSLQFSRVKFYAAK